MSKEDRDRIYSRASPLTDEERCLLAAAAGLAPARMMDCATHAICMHGVIAEITEDHHSCRWAKLVPPDSKARP